jgi:hypothetical protein
MAHSLTLLGTLSCRWLQPVAYSTLTVWQRRHSFGCKGVLASAHASGSGSRGCGFQAASWHHGVLTCLLSTALGHSHSQPYVR